MKLTSVEFLVFLFVVAGVNGLLPPKTRRYLILAASLAFYAMLAPEYLPALLLVVIVSYSSGLRIEGRDGPARKRSYFLGLGILLALLVSFKYAGALRSLLDLKSRASLPPWLSSIGLPLGFSFLIFTALAYLIDVNRRKIPAEKNFPAFAAALLFFPKLAQGPIERAGMLLPQVSQPGGLDEGRVTQGLKRILLGFFKKLVVADRLAVFTGMVFGNIEQHNGSTLFLAMVFYAVEIYADFSGYTDIAIGSAKILGITLSENFERPYFARSIKEFWGRWHMTLSAWLRDYLFLPLAYFFSRRFPKSRTLGVKTESLIYAAATMITFGLCGLWHGEGLHFLIWGLLFGVYLSVGQASRKFRERVARRTGFVRFPRLRNAWKILFTFSLVTVTWLFFAVPRLADIGLILKKLLSFPGRPFLLSGSQISYSLTAIFLMALLDWSAEYGRGLSAFFESPRRIVRYISFAALAVLILMIGFLDEDQFIYFRF